MAHHTKDKGDIGVAKACADLVVRGYVVLLPMSEHTPFDVVAYDEGRFWRIQVKYRTARTGAFTVHFRSVWADQHGTHTRSMDKDEVDLVCVYCPETDRCYYLRPADFRRSVTVRVVPARNCQVSGVLAADDLTVFPPP